MGEPVRLTTEMVNETLAEVLFSQNMSGKPVYAVPDEVVMREVATRVGVPADQALRLLLRTAAIQIGIEGTSGSQPFAKLARGVSRERRLDTPQGLTTLAVLSLAADAMHAGGTMAANNYYGRLHELLDTPEARRASAEHGYRQHAEDLWEGLNSWLEAWEGERGVPTAYAVGSMRFVGLPLSQALVRRADREKLPSMFVLEALPPGYRIAPADMEATLDSWMTRTPPFFTHTLRSLWTNPLARERIVAVACLELETWDGAELRDADTNSLSRSRTARLIVQVAKFPRTALRLDLGLPAASDELTDLRVKGPSGAEQVQLRPAAAGMARLRDPAILDMGSLLTNELESTDERGTTYCRRPRRVIPLRFDDLQQAYVEEESAQLGETTLVLAASELDQRVTELLGKVARPGWEQLPADTLGLPEGWSAFRDVEILDRIGSVVHVDLQPLLPRASVSLVLSGGLLLPGLLRKWSSLMPPEIHATSTGADSIEVEVHRGSRVGDTVASEKVDGAVAVIDLVPYDLADGEYLVVVKVDGASKPSATALMRLRSAESPEIRRATSRLVYGPDSGPLWPVTAGVESEEPGVDGARVALKPCDVSTSASMPSGAARPPRPRATVRTQPVRVGLGLGSDSCMRTGMHRLQYPTYLGGAPTSRSIEGVCDTCGLVKRSPSTAAGAAARKRLKAQKKWQPPDLSAIPRIVAPDDGGWGPAFDGLCHVGTGTPAALSRLLSQMDGSALGVDVFVRSLEALGHVDLVRDPRTLEVREWEITPSTLVGLADDRWVLVGRRNQKQVRQLTDLVIYAKGEVVQELDHQIPFVGLAIARDPLLEVVDVLREDWADLELSQDTSRRLALALPPLSALRTGMSRMPVPAIKSVEAWDPKAAAWVPDGSIERVGAYRLTNRGRVYAVRDETDIAGGTITLANAQLAKHLANLWAGDPLARYDERSRSVVTPLGADLPGLYARALTLASGRLPVAREEVPLLQYHAVPREVADVVHDRLTS